MLVMSIQQGTAGFFWAVMRVEADGFFEPAGDRSLTYFKSREACRKDAVNWCDEIGIPHPEEEVSEEDKITVTIGEHTA